MNSTADIMDRGMSCLLEKLGTIETERFISTVIRERFDYTEWRREYFEGMTVQEMNAAAVSHDEAEPFHPKKQQTQVE